jgi:KDO2-lipid IV(A) lauroyltransferase
MTNPQNRPTPESKATLILFIVGLVSRVPFSLRSAFGFCAGYLVGCLPIRERRFALLQLKVFMPNISAARTTRRVFANMGQTLLESLNIKPILKKSSSRIQCSNWEQVEKWSNDSRPLIALTAHTGNWDLLAAWVISRGIPLTTIGREARSPRAQAVLKRIRENYGIETIWRSDRSGLKRLISCLSERRVLAALIDQDTRVESIPVTFFGSPAKTPVSLITLGKKMNARFVTALIFRTGWLRYQIFVEEIPDQQSEQQLLEIYNNRLESLIRIFPNQWVWFHKRWRSPDQNTTLSSREYESLLLSRVRAKIALLLFILTVTVSACASIPTASNLELAESLTAEGRYEDAIESYRRQIDERAGSTRPAWENPYFYLIAVSDLQLRLNKPGESLATCEEAEERGVDLKLVSDCYRTIALYYTEREQFYEAFNLLKKHREIDPLLFDALLDRVGREITRREEKII